MANSSVTQVPTGCQHYWLLPIADGPTSRGVCKRCGALKEFYNSCEISNNPTNRPVRNNGYYPERKGN